LAEELDNVSKARHVMHNIDDRRHVSGQFLPRQVGGRGEACTPPTQAQSGGAIGCQGIEKAREAGCLPFDDAQDAGAEDADCSWHELLWAVDKHDFLLILASEPRVSTKPMAL